MKMGSAIFGCHGIKAYNEKRVRAPKPRLSLIL